MQFGSCINELFPLTGVMRVWGQWCTAEACHCYWCVRKKLHMQMDRKATVLSAGFYLFCLFWLFFSLCALKGKITALKQGINQVLRWTFQCQQYNFSRYGEDNIFPPASLEIFTVKVTCVTLTSYLVHINVIVFHCTNTYYFFHSPLCTLQCTGRVLLIK